MPSEKNPWVAAALSLLPGAGQLYNGERQKGIALLAVGVILWAATRLAVALCVAAVPFHLYVAYDAYARANAYNLALRTTGRPPW